MPQTKPVISVENVVASASVDQKIDLIEVTKKHLVELSYLMAWIWI